MNPVSQPQSPTPLTRDSSPPITTGPVLNEQMKLNDFSNTRRPRRLNSVLLKIKAPYHSYSLRRQKFRWCKNREVSNNHQQVA